MAARDALDATGYDYLAAERAVAAEGEPAIAGLEPELASPDPVRRLTAQALLERARGSTAGERLLARLDELAARYERTVAGYPSPSGVALDLEERFGEALVPTAAAYLVKLGDVWDWWRTAALALYLARANVPGSNAPVVRFAATTPNDDLRDAVLDGFTSYPDDDAAPALRAELDRAGEPERHANARPQLEAALLRLQEGTA